MDLLEYALAYRSLGWSVIPIVPPVIGAKDYNKKPYVKWKEFMVRIAKEKEIMRWWKQWPKANPGIVTGKVSMLTSLDIDNVQGKMIYQDKIGDLPATISQHTGGGPNREQYLFTYPLNGFVGNYVDIFGNKTGVDIRGERGYIVVPPSLHKTGNRYAWGDINPLEMGLNDLYEFPKELLNYLNSLTDHEKKKNPEDWQNELLRGVDDGYRHEALMKLCGWWLYENQDRQKTLLLLEGWNQRNRPPLEKSELITAVDNIAKKEGLNELRTLSGVYFDNITYYHSIDGEANWVISINKEEYNLSADEIRSNAKFSSRILKLTGIYLLPIAPKKWHPMMQKLMTECQRKEKTFESTKYGPIAEVISNMLENCHDSTSFIDRTPIRHNDEFWIKKRVLMRKFERTEKITSDVVKDTLQKLGFIYDNKLRNENNKNIRTWHIKINDLQKKLDDLI